jgi:diguanylate cyclase (GGDEF)-like protein/PAS domain S-box-containing protein
LANKCTANNEALKDKKGHLIVQNLHGQPVMIVGGGRGGFALLELFLEDPLVRVVAVVDRDPSAPAIQVAKFYEIATYNDASEAFMANKDVSDVIIYNLTHDDTVAKQAAAIFGDKKVTDGLEAKLFWQIVMNLKRIKDDLESSQVQLNAIIYNALDGIITFNDQGEINGFNPAAEQIFGYDQESIIGQNVQAILPDLVEKGDGDFIDRFLRSRDFGLVGISSYEMSAERKSGQRFPLELSTSEMILNGARYFVCIARDITERKIIEERTKYAAHHDYLTGLPNRAQFLECLQYAIPLAKRNNHKVALLFLDLDGFKYVNDTLGHANGDLLLKEVASRLKVLIRSSDLFSRMGGDEFTFILNNIGNEQNATLVAHKIIEALSKPVDLNGQICHIGGSVGIAMYPDDSDEAESLLHKADEAMYLAKKSGKNNSKLFRDLQITA